MAEINFNNLYNQLNPMDKRYYDQQFSKNYVPGQENTMLSSQPAYEQMKAVYDAQQQVPEKGFFDFFNFGEASAAEKPQVPNLDYGYSMPTFDLGTGITNTTAATNMYSPFMDNQEKANRDIVQEIIAENQAENYRRLMTQPGFTPQATVYDPYGIRVEDGRFSYDMNKTSLADYQTPQSLGFDTSYGIANEPDVKQVDYLPGQKKSFRDSATLEEYFQNRSPLQGIEKLMSYLPFGENSIMGKLIRRALPQENPEIKSMKNFYRNQYGLTPTGQVASGIMAGYNPVYGGALNMITGGRFGTPTQFGLANAARQRIENIAKRRAPQTDASRAKIAELQKFARADTISRARQAAPDVYREAERQGFTGPGGGFSTAGSGRDSGFSSASSSPSGRGRQDY
jgi:hypothetical protein